MAKFTCPFCIRKYNKSEVLYSCPDCGESTTPNIFEREPIKCKNASCGRFATLRKCPGCGHDIPKTALETPNLPFSIIGVTTSGKTNYITVMLHELGKASSLGLALEHQNKETLAHQRENYSYIYDRHIRPESTESGANMPQIWCIRAPKKKHGDHVPAYTFTIFDGAGEDHENNLDPSSTVCRYINASQAIILVIDPLTLSSIRRGGVVDPVVMENSLGGYKGETKNAADIINSVASYIKSARGIKTSKMLTIPVAVVLTKFDTIINHRSFGPHALVKSRSLSIRDGKVNTTEIQQVHGEIRNWLYEIGESAFINMLESHFREFYFFGVSSFGAPPVTRDTLVNEIRPHRVLDPILWLFKKSKFID
jgi:rRNA maturation protein Nop10